MSTNEIKLEWPLLGNDHVVNFLSRALANDQLSGSYIFVGPDDLGKTTVASYFAYSLLCQNRNNPAYAKAAEGKVVLPCGVCPSCKQHKLGLNPGEEESLASVHADLHVIKREKDKKNLSIEQVRGLIGELSLSSFLNSYKIGIIKHADSLSDEAGNALLKTLEEPRDKVVVILIATELANLPQTIVSRSQVLRFRSVSNDVIYQYLVKDHNANRSQAKSLARLSLGRPALAVKFFEDKEFYDSYVERTRTLLGFWRSDLNGRFAAIGDLLGTKATGQEAVTLSRRILETWQGLARDLILFHTGQVDLVQHEIVMPELEAVSRTLPLPAVFRLFQSIRQAEDYLKANVSPRSALESVAMAV
jgi:DNA polymerase-3 subunit delta'